MPIYQYAHSGAPLGLAERDRIAKGILEIHHSVTNAPEPFVRVVFTPLPLGTVYCAGEIAPSAILNCNIRAGRTEQQIDELMMRCYALIADVTGLAPDQIVISVGQTPGPHIVEAGLILPEPNDEAEDAWIAKLQHTYPGRYDDWGIHGKRPADPTTSGHVRATELRKLVQEYLQLGKREGVKATDLLNPVHQLIQKELTANDRPKLDAAATGAGTSR